MYTHIYRIYIICMCVCVLIIDGKPTTQYGYVGCGELSEIPSWLQFGGSSQELTHADTGRVLLLAGLVEGFSHYHSIYIYIHMIPGPQNHCFLYSGIIIYIEIYICINLPLNQSSDNWARNGWYIFLSQAAGILG